MTVRKIIRFPDKRLKQACVEVGPIGADIAAIWQDLDDTNMSLAGNVGLSAPQIGVLLRLCVVDGSETRDQVVCMADPVLRPIVSEGTFWSAEGSPCLPGVMEHVERNSRVEAEYTDETGQRVTRIFDGLWAASVQHQVDHMNGKLFIDKLSRVKRDMAVRKVSKRTPKGRV